MAASPSEIEALRLQRLAGQNGSKFIKIITIFALVAREILYISALAAQFRILSNQQTHSKGRNSFEVWN